MTKHTPGPWVVANLDDANEMFEMESDFPLGIYPASDLNNEDECANAMVFVNNNWGEFRANAHLIAAAPDMLEALPDLIECAEMLAAQCRVSGDHAHAAMYQARADLGKSAIAKAEGRA